jgi:hypothetical protein
LHIQYSIKYPLTLQQAAGTSPAPSRTVQRRHTFASSPEKKTKKSETRHKKVELRSKNNTAAPSHQKVTQQKSIPSASNEHQLVVQDRRRSHSHMNSAKIDDQRQVPMFKQRRAFSLVESTVNDSDFPSPTIDTELAELFAIMEASECLNWVMLLSCLTMNVSRLLTLRYSYESFLECWHQFKPALLHTNSAGYREFIRILEETIFHHK